MLHVPRLRTSRPGFVETAGGRLVYQSHETAPIVITRRYDWANTNPLAFKWTALFQFEDRESPETALRLGVLKQVREASSQLYRRVPTRDALPAALRKPSV